MGGRRKHHRRSMHGRGILSFLGSANRFLRKHKILSTAGNALSGIHPGFGYAGKALNFLGYGRRHRRGGGLTLAGGRRHHRRMR